MIVRGGSHILSQTIGEKTTIDVTDLKEGVYTLTIKTVDLVTNKKLGILR